MHYSTKDVKWQEREETKIMNKDLTVGKPESVLWRFCLPLFGSIIFQQLYNLADSFVAGKFVGEEALAAVGNGYEITLIFLAFAFGCNIGCSVIVSRLFGAKKIRGNEGCGIYYLDWQWCFMPGADVHGYGMLYKTFTDYPYAGKYYCRFTPVSGYLYYGASVCILL